uniref:Cytochrome c oxidase subunit 3 n=1 Tax=Brachiopoda sp. TaxID=3230945 RepID=A0AAU8HQB2_9BILA
MRTRTPYHLVEQSPWPIVASISTLAMAVGTASYVNASCCFPLSAGVYTTIGTAILWWRDVTRESTLQGFHTSFVANNLKMGMILFITSEVLFFFAFFWAYFQSSLGPDSDLGTNWPPTGPIPLNPLSVPLLNTMVLLMSGVTLTWAHHSLIEKEMNKTAQGLTLTVILGFYFTFLQYSEYSETSFTTPESAFGSVFFIATGFHGAHVVIGSIFLSVCLTRHLSRHFSPGHHFGFEAAAWYWHFVDVVWLFLFTCLYWWGA